MTDRRGSQAEPGSASGDVPWAAGRSSGGVPLDGLSPLGDSHWGQVRLGWRSSSRSAAVVPGCPCGRSAILFCRTREDEGHPHTGVSAGGDSLGEGSGTECGWRLIPVP